MARNHNKLSFIGRLGRDPEMRYTPSGKATTSFSVAVNGGTTEKPVTTWYSCQAWEKQAEVVNQYLHKGNRVFVEGVLIPDAATGGPRVWSDREGNVRSSFEVTVREIEFLSDKPEGENGKGVKNGEPGGYRPLTNDDDIPF